MKLKVIACKVLSREVSLLNADCPNFLDVTYLRQGYHDTPEILRNILKGEIERIETGSDPYSSDTSVRDFDAILLGYGLCSNGIAGLTSEKYTIVAPRAHDCVTLFLGSKEKYLKYFNENSGTYWYTDGWIENTLMPGPDYRGHYYKKYVAQYGEENAEYLADNALSWLSNYKRCAYIGLEEFEHGKGAEFTRKCAGCLNFEYDYVKGDIGLLRRFLWGDWNPEDFLVLPPGKKITASNDTDIISAE